MLRWLAVALTLLALPAVAEVVDIDSAELARLQAAGVPLVDIRTEAEWRETGIVPGSRLLTFFDAQGRADPAAWLQKLQTVVRADQPVILICRSGNRTRAASDFLSRQAGYAKVYNVRQGIRGWMQEGRGVSLATPVLAKCVADRPC